MFENTGVGIEHVGWRARGRAALERVKWLLRRRCERGWRRNAGLASWGQRVNMHKRSMERLIAEVIYGVR